MSTGELQMVQAQDIAKLRAIKSPIAVQYNR